jgi:anaerobic magnesium-protoporphyrin IX monomethyl ester cyclase
MISFFHLLINQDTKAHSPPIGVLSLVSTLHRGGIPAQFNQFMHLKGEQLSPEGLADRFRQADGILAVSIMINVLPLLIMALRILRQTDTERIVVVGGPGMVGIGREVLCTTPEVDIVSFGEGEMTAVPLFQKLLDGATLRDVPGIHYRQNGMVLSNPAAERVACLDEFELPDYSRIDLRQYHGVGIMASRGCPFGCTFCDVAPAWGRKNTRRSIDHVLDEMQILRDDLGIHDIGFADDLFILDRSWVTEFCNRKIQRGIDISWRCNGHINLANIEVSSIMKASHCRSIFFGIESGSNSTLMRIKKNFTIEKAFRVVSETLQYMDVSTNFMWGFPGDSLGDLKDTLMARNRLESIGATSSLVMLAPLAQSPICSDVCPKKFIAAMPNIFCEDYRELDPRYLDAWNNIISTNPASLSAFYHFDVPGLEDMVEIVGIDKILKSTLDHAKNSPLWSRV